MNVTTSSSGDKTATTVSTATVGSLMEQAAQLDVFVRQAAVTWGRRSRLRPAKRCTPATNLSTATSARSLDGTHVRRLCVLARPASEDRTAASRRPYVPAGRDQLVPVRRILAVLLCRAGVRTVAAGAADHVAAGRLRRSTARHQPSPGITGR